MAGRKQNYGVKAHVQRSFFFALSFLGAFLHLLKGGLYFGFLKCTV